MKFKELLDKYKNNTATEEEKQLIESEIEKYEAIEEYLADNFNLDFAESFEEKSQTHEIISINKSVNKRLRKVVITSVSIVLLIFISIFYIVSPIIDGMYYNPAAHTISEYRDDFHFDLTAFTELNLPGYVVSTVLSERKGFGKYNIYFTRRDLFTEGIENIHTTIDKGQRIGTFEDYFVGRSVSMDAFLNVTNAGDRVEYEIDDEISIKKNSYTIEHLKKLSPASYISAYLTFKEDLSMEEISSIIDKYKNYGLSNTVGDYVKVRWVGVRTSPRDENTRWITGFNPNPNDFPSYSNGEVGKYPALNLSDWFRSNLYNPPVDMPAGYEEHYKDLLRFMIDREDMVRTLDANPLKTDYYKDSLEYVETNGVHSFGVLVHGNADRMIEFINNENIANVTIKQVLPAKPFINLY